MLTHWIWLSMLPRGSDQLKMKLLEHFHDPEDIYYADETALRAVDGLTAQALEALRIRIFLRPRRSWSSANGRISVWSA